MNQLDRIVEEEGVVGQSNTLESSLLLPDVMLPSQFNGRIKKQPEHKLILALLADALHQATNGRERIKDEAIRWFMSTAPPTPFTFTFVCEVFDFNPEHWRDLIRSGRRIPSKFRLKHGWSVLRQRVTLVDL